jgi:hypothetical protein
MSKGILSRLAEIDAGQYGGERLDPLERQAAVNRFLDKQTDEEWQRLRNVLCADLPPRVIVTISGGSYQSAACTANIDLDILDYDNWQGCDDEAHSDEMEHFAALEREIESLKTDPSAVLF